MCSSLTRVRLVNSRYFKKVQKTRTRYFEWNIPFKNPVSKFPCQPILPTPGSLFFFARIPTLASLNESRLYIIFQLLLLSYIQASALDPLLDDSVEFVRKLHKLEKPAELYILDKLPHGFLNFQPFSTEAREGCDLLIACIKKSLNMGMRRLDSTQSLGYHHQHQATSYRKFEDKSNLTKQK